MRGRKQVKEYLGAAGDEEEAARKNRRPPRSIAGRPAARRKERRNSLIAGRPAARAVAELRYRILLRVLLSYFGPTFSRLFKAFLVILSFTLCTLFHC